MSKGPGSGDKLARGAVKAQFMTTESSITDDKWARAFDDFDPEKFKNEPNPAQIRSSNPGSEEGGTSGADAGTVVSSE